MRRATWRHTLHPPTLKRQHSAQSLSWRARSTPVTTSFSFFFLHSPRRIPAHITSINSPARKRSIRMTRPKLLAPAFALCPPQHQLLHLPRAITFAPSAVACTLAQAPQLRMATAEQIMNSEGRCVFGQKSYWDDMYSGSGQRASDAYSWYCAWAELAPFWAELVPSKQARVLIAGIGNDPTPVDIHDAGWNDMTAFDYSEEGVRRAAQLFGRDRLGPSSTVRLLNCDARDLPLADASVDATLDKGTLDAIYITGKEVFADSVKELGRVTAEGGILVSISRVILPEELIAAFDSPLWEMIHDGGLAFAPDGEATIDLGAELYSWRRTAARFEPRKCVDFKR